MEKTFGKVANAVTRFAGSMWATLLAFISILAWTIGGFFFGFTDTYQLIVNTGTTIVTFLMVFLIQHTQNRDSLAIHIKLDELIRVLKRADNAIISAEQLDSRELMALSARYKEMASQKDPDASKSS